MWIFSQDGFFSIVRKPGDGDLTIRARCAADLDRLRERWLPTLGPTIHGGGTDYPVRARCAPRQLGDALLAMALDLDYPNFKDRLAATLGELHVQAAHAVWAAMRGIETAPAPDDGPPDGMRPAYGGVVVDGTGERVLMREPRGHFGGYVWTFAKGRPERGEDGPACACREIREELGCIVTGLLTIPGWFAGDTTATRFYLCRWQADAGRPDPGETAQVQWASWEEAAALIGQTTSRRGRERDLAVLAAARQLLRRLP